MGGTSRTQPRRALLANAALLALVGLGDIYLSLSLQRADWAMVWLAAGLVASQGLLIIGLRSRPQSKGIEPTVEAMMCILDAQTDAICGQQAEIAHLRTALVAPPAQETHRVLAYQAVPDLSGVVERLAQAEASLPEMLPQTRAWIGRVRGLARQTQAQIEAISGDSSDRPPRDN